ncbi:MAG: hypothetical protein KY468_03490 [Armatimonadetes bacterium]|nr:hypothetical protein [Armatimonadota bacterium]
MPDTLQEALEALETLLAKAANPKVACESKCNRTITLQYSQWDEPGEYAYRWNCDATADCGYANEHFCRFQPLSADGYGETPMEALQECLSKLTEIMESRVEMQQLEAEEEEL